jgi:hypothetical protein
MRFLRIILMLFCMLLLAVLVLGGGGYGFYHYAAAHPAPWMYRLLSGPVSRELALQQLEAVDLEISARSNPPGISGRCAIRLTGSAERTRCHFLLNRGLRITSVSCEGRARTWLRLGEMAAVSIPDASAGTTVEIEYEGVPESVAGLSCLFDRNRIILPRRTFWYPMDMHSFHEFTCRLRLPEGMMHAGGKLEAMESGQEIHTITMAHPVMGAALAAGRYARTARKRGEIWYFLYTPETPAPEEEAFFEWGIRAHQHMTSLFGGDGFSAQHLILDPAVHTAFNGANAVTAMAPPEHPERREERAALARLLARNWWGGTVSGRWFQARPRGSAWLHEGLSGYAAWRTLRDLEGRRAAIRFREEQRIPAQPGLPLKIPGLADAFFGQKRTKRLLETGAPWTAWMIANSTGHDAFIAACHNTLAIHRHSTINSATFFHELQLASEKPLDEMLRVCFEHSGSFDYALEQVAMEGNKVQAVLGNRGGIPAAAPLEIAVVSGDTIRFHTVRPGIGGGVFLLPADGGADRVILDPGFDAPDVRRANNVWPRMIWPAELSAAGENSLALRARSEWMDETPGMTFVWRPGMEKPLRTAAPAPSAAAADPVSRFPRVWMDEYDMLRITKAEHCSGSPIPLPGEVLDFTRDAAALYALTAETRRLLPARAWARYYLWRIPLDTLQPERLEFRPDQSF